MSDKPRLTYAEAGVSVDAGNAFVERIRRAVGRTARPEVLGDLGGFGALFDARFPGIEDPVLVAGADGVGTKILLHERHGTHGWAGRDLVAMCVNDVAAQGAEPLFFLDYLACGELEQETLAEVVEGVAEACAETGCALIGGETAEMPGMYPAGRYDLAGFCVGVAPRARLITGEAIRPGDALIGLASSGPHANGFSLIRRLLELGGVEDLAEARLPDGTPAVEAVLAPTRLYVRAVRTLIERGVPLHGLAHVTGGGFYDNLERILPTTCRARIEPSSWPTPPAFDWLLGFAEVPPRERYRTFNMGVGFVVVTPEPEAALEALAGAGERAWAIGRVEPRAEGEPAVAIEGVD